jgi:hypothetical protein
VAKDTKAKKLAQRLDSASWGLLFLLVAALSLPNGNLEYVSAASVGAAMVGLNIARRALGIEIGWFSLILGAAFMIGGTAAVFGMKMDVFVLFFALAGAVMIVGAVVGRDRDRDHPGEPSAA